MTFVSAYFPFVYYCARSFTAAFLSFSDPDLLKYQKDIGSGSLIECYKKGCS